MTDTSLVFAGKIDTVSQWADISGYDNHAIQPTAANQPSIISGNISIAMNATSGGLAYYFDGAASPNCKYFYIPHNNSLNFNDDWTLTFWINTKSTDRLAIFDKYISGVGIYIHMSYPTQVGKVYLRIDDTNGVGATLFNYKIINDGLWHNIVIQRCSNDGDFKMFTDGQYDRNFADIYGDHRNSAPIYIGASSGIYHPFKGYMLAPKFWQRVLTPSEIEENYKLGLINIRG